MNEALIAEVAAECAAEWHREHAVTTDISALRAFVGDILYKSRQLIPAFEEGIILLTEVASATADRVHAWMLRQHPHITEQPGMVYPTPNPHIVRLTEIIERHTRAR
jgi:hypothetical protein